MRAFSKLPPNCHRAVPWVVAVLVCCVAQCLVAQTKPLQAVAAHGEHGMVASVNPIATDAGVSVLKNGGNTVDAAVAVALTLGVVDGSNSGIGGGCFMLIRLADGSAIAIDGRETAPAAASRDMYVLNGKANTELSQVGPSASGVPGALAAYAYAVRKYGRKELKDSLLPSAAVAENGFKPDEHYAAMLRDSAKDLARFEASRAIFLKSNGTPYKQGEVLKQPDLAATYRNVAEQGIGWFYQGPFGDMVENWMKQHGGIMTARDLQDYKIVLREPLASPYRGYQIVTFPPPSSGGVHVVEILNILEPFDIKSLDEPTRLHLIAEAMKLAFADRAYWLGDPDFVPVPLGLISKPYSVALGAKINLHQASAGVSHGTPADWQTSVFKKHTTHFCVADAQGNWVACTATVNTSFGSKVVIPGTGVVMNNEMDDFSTQPGTANFFGLVSAEANAVAPGKRPLSSMAPTIVLQNGKPILALGAAGGPTIISQVVLSLINILDLGMPPELAISQPRIHHQWSPDQLSVEKTLSGSLQTSLKKRGHKLSTTAAMGVTQIIARDLDGTGFTGVADPRAQGKAAGW